MDSPRIGRRTLLKGAVATSVAAATGGATVLAGVSLSTVSENARLTPGKVLRPDPTTRIRGVNLGSWLVVEKWMTPEVFAGVDAGDEFTLCTKLGPQAAAARLHAHQESYITEADFQWLAAHGVNAVRLPVGYWVLGGEPPYVGSAETLDRAFRQARTHGISVLVDLHGAPGSQNGWDHSGRAGALNWPHDPANVAHTLNVIERLADHCSQYDNLLGIELLNEPRWDVPLDTLKQYYLDGYARIRKTLSPERAVVVIHDGFRPNNWAGFMPEPEYSNVLLDTHIYQCYTDEDKRRDIYGHIAVAAGRHIALDVMQKQLPVIVGEWSAALGGESYTGCTPFEQSIGRSGYAAAQLISYDRTRGWFFWSYRNPYAEWSFRTSVERGILPASFADAV